MGAGVALAGPQTAQPSLETVVARMSDYLARYADDMSTVVAREQYEQHVTGPDGERAVRLESEFALVRLAGSRAWLGFRDVLRVDGRPVQDRENRLAELLNEPPAGAFVEARRIADESARFNIGPLQRNFNNPTTALELLDRRHRDTVRFSRAGMETSGGRSVLILKFREHARPTIIRTPGGRHVPAEGRAWIDPSSGAVVRTALHLRDFTPDRSRATIDVLFGLEPALKLWVPVEFSERYEVGDGLVIGGKATYSNYRRFRTISRIKPKLLTPDS
jgi:hypothetical protein